MKSINLHAANLLVQRKHHLTDDTRIDDIVQIVRDLCGLHATGSTVPYLSLFARTRSFVKEHLDEELYAKRSLGKIRCMRGTLHILTKEMIPVVNAATRRMIEKTSKRFAEFRGVSNDKYEEASKSIQDVLKGGAMTASEIRKALKTELDVSAILYLMCDQGLLIRSRPEKGWRDKNHKYTLFHEYFPDIDLEMDELEARTLLVHRYMNSFGPVTENDIAWWTGMGKTRVREALNKIQEQTVQIEVSNLKSDFILLRSDVNLIKTQAPLKKRTVNLLPSLDPYLMGYKERERYLDYNHYSRTFDRSGNATSTILLDGRVVGVWDYAEDERPLVKLLLFEGVERDVLREIRSKTRKIGRFIADREVKVEECDSMVPLTRRTAGGVMSPLKGC